MRSVKANTPVPFWEDKLEVFSLEHSVWTTFTTANGGAKILSCVLAATVKVRALAYEDVSFLSRNLWKKLNVFFHDKYFLCYSRNNSQKVILILEGLQNQLDDLISKKWLLCMLK